MIPFESRLERNQWYSMHQTGLSFFVCEVSASWIIITVSFLSLLVTGSTIGTPSHDIWLGGFPAPETWDPRWSFRFRSRYTARRLRRSLMKFPGAFQKTEIMRATDTFLEEIEREVRMMYDASHCQKTHDSGLDYFELCPHTTENLQSSKNSSDVLCPLYSAEVRQSHGSVLTDFVSGRAENIHPIQFCFRWEGLKGG